MSDKKLCLICEEGHVTECKDAVEIERNGVTGFIYDTYHLCDTCGSEYANWEQMRVNNQSRRAFYEHVDRVTNSNMV